MQTIITVRPAPWLYIFWILIGIVAAWMSFDLVSSSQSLSSVVLGIVLIIAYVYMVATQFAYTIKLTSSTITFRDASKGHFIARHVAIPLPQIHAVYLGQPNFILDHIDGQKQDGTKTFTTGAVVGTVSPVATPHIITTRTEPWLTILTESGRVYAINLKPYSKDIYKQLLAKLQELHIPVHTQQELDS